MRASLPALASALLLAACIAAPPRAELTTLTAADPATALIAGQTASLARQTQAVRNDDPLTLLELRFGDGRVMRFEEANHAPHDLVVQRAGGALAQVMGLDDAATPTLYRARDVTRAGAFCAPSGPLAIGVSDGASGVRIVALKEDFQVDDRAGGGYDVAPTSPSMVCARLAFTKR